MSVKTIAISVDSVINLLRDLTHEEKEEIFEKVFIEEDTHLLSSSEQISLVEAEQNLIQGETISWPFGG